MEKKCCKCKKIKPIDDFQRDSRNKDGLRGDCKSCSSQYKKKYRAKVKIQNKLKRIDPNKVEIPTKKHLFLLIDELCNSKKDSKRALGLLTYIMYDLKLSFTETEPYTYELAIEHCNDLTLKNKIIKFVGDKEKKGEDIGDKSIMICTSQYLNKVLNKGRVIHRMVDYEGNKLTKLSTVSLRKTAIFETFKDNGYDFPTLKGRKRNDMLKFIGYGDISEKVKPVKNKTLTYLMKNKRNGYYKIGVSVDPLYREQTLQSEDPDIIMVKVWDKNIERNLHNRYNDQRLRGEWFNLSKIQVRYICTHY